MTFPSATFTAVAPPADGLVLAFTAARRRRNSKAMVTAFGGAVAIVSALSFLAPAGQTLVQEPLPPAHRPVAPDTVAPDTVVRPQAPAPASVVHRSVPATRVLPADIIRPAAVQPTRITAAPVRRAAGMPPAERCPKHRRLACAAVHTPASAGGVSVLASVCPSGVAVTVQSTGSSPVAAPRPQTVRVGSGSCDTD